MNRFTVPSDLGLLRDALEAHFGKGGTYGFKRNDDHVGLNGVKGGRFAVGHRAVCTDYAMAVFAALVGELECKIMWIGRRHSPDAGLLVGDDSHDFCVALDRFIIDAWAKEVAKSSPRAVLDLHDPEDAVRIRFLYGNPGSFMRLSSLETKVCAVSGTQSADEDIGPRASVVSRSIRCTS